MCKISAYDGVNVDGSLESERLHDAYDLYIIDGRGLWTSLNDPIWTVPIAEWTSQDERLRSQEIILTGVRNIVKWWNDGKSSGLLTIAPPYLFSIVILGYEDSFADDTYSIISKLQRHMILIYSGVTINFINLQCSTGEVGEPSIALAIGKMLSCKSGGSVRTIDSILALTDSSRPEPETTRSTMVGKCGSALTIPPIAQKGKKAKVTVLLSFDFDAVSAYLGTGTNPANSLADYSAGVFAARVGCPRLLRILSRYQLSHLVTWFVPGHTMETFPDEARDVVESGAEIALHGYCHEGAGQMTEDQERDVLVKSMECARRLTGKRVLGYRAPMYALRESTVALLRKQRFLYDSSLSHHDSQPYFTPADPAIERIDFSQPASSWMHPTPLEDTMRKPPIRPDQPYDSLHPLVEIPVGWNNEDMMALQYYPHVANTNGQVDARVVEHRWRDMFLWLRDNAADESDDASVLFPLLMHPDSSGLAHAVGMAERMIAWLRGWSDDSVRFCTYEAVATQFLQTAGLSMHHPWQGSDGGAETTTHS